MKKKFLLFLLALYAVSISAANDVTFNIQGVEENDTVYAYISSNTYLKRMVITSDGQYTFSDIPAGCHSLKLEANGYNLPQAKSIVVNADGSVNPSVAINLAVTKASENPNQWSHHWEDDGSISGYVTTAHINQPTVIEYLGKKIVPSEVSYASSLYASHKIILANDESPWSEEYAYRLSETLSTIPNGWELAWQGKTMKFILTDMHVEDDIKILETSDSTMDVTLSADAFYYANPFLVSLDGVRGRFFSKRLHHAIVKLATDYGRNRDAANAILESRFGCSINVPSYEDLTSGITNEDASCFQDFMPSELVAIINMLEELPEGYHVTPHLKYLIRRQNGHYHPIYHDAAAVSWCVDNGYIEFMEWTFGGNNESFETQRLILHEKTHFLWAYSFSHSIKDDWIKVGGWYEDPNNFEGWATTKDVEFVTEYAHAKNPDEDMAESVAFYLKNPDKLLSRAPEKYEFIRDRIMHGTRYVSKIRDDLTFEVLNLFPDYDYPGKIKRLDIKVEGAPEEDKHVTIEVELNHIDGLTDGASGAITRISSPEAEKMGLEQYYDIGFVPVDGNQHLLRGDIMVSKYSRTDYWYSVGINLYDEHGNARMTNNNDIAWNLYIGNPLEDLEQPKYHPGTLAYELCDTILEDGHHAQNWKITCKVTDDVQVQSGVIRIGCEKYYSWNDLYGTYDDETQLFTFKYIVPDFYKEADYYVESLIIRDMAGNPNYISFSDSPLHQPRVYQTITTPNPDYEDPELDLNRIVVYAEPTNKMAPDGETLVTITFYARDNNSGVGRATYMLRDPQGIDHFEWIYHRNFFTTYFDGDPTVWEKYTTTTILPQGSAPGIWGLANISLEDKALNSKTFNFVETCIFEPDNSNTDYILFAEMEEGNNSIAINMSSDTYNIDKYNYRIIHDETGMEISGEVDLTTSNNSKARAPRFNTNMPGLQFVDVSSLPDGEIIVITTAMDSDGNNLAVKSAKLNKIQQGIDGISSASDSRSVDVYTLQGYLVGSKVKVADLQKTLRPGVYVINNKKIIIR